MPVGETGDGMRGEFNRGRECIERLRPGDRIALIATAMVRSCNTLYSVATLIRLVVHWMEESHIWGVYHSVL